MITSASKSRPAKTLSAVQCRLADRLAGSALGGFGYWWTEGSINVPSMARIMPGLPPPADFALLLTPGQGIAEEAAPAY